MSSHPSTQPIALPPSNHHPDHRMSSVGSYTGSNGDFNPASFTRHFLGSPISWRAGSFGARVPSGSPTAYLLNSLDPSTFKMSSSLESDRGSLLNALNVFDREGELCRNYTCCGHHLNDLHALLEHFEEVHLAAIDPNAPNAHPQIQVPFNPQSHPPLQNPQRQQQQQPSYYPARMPQPYSAPIDPDEMELELDLDNSIQSQQHFHQNYPQFQHLSSAHSSPSSGAPSPPDTPISTPLSSYPSPTSFHPNQQHMLQAHSPYASQPSSPHASTFDPTRRSSNSPPSVPAATRPNLNLNLAAATPFSSRGMITQQFANPEDAFNPYARFSSDYSSCLPGAQYNPASVDEANMHPGIGAVATTGGGALQSPHLAHLQHGFSQQGHSQPGQNSQGIGCVTPALLFSGTTTPASTPATSRVPSPTGGYSSGLGIHPNALSQGNTPISSVPTTPISPSSRSPTSAKPNTLTRHASASSLNSRPTSSLLLSKPFKCPKPNCNKSYKQANGLKYHITHGSCNFAPPKDLEHVKDLLERKRREKQAESGNPISPRSPTLGDGVGASSLLIASEYPDLSSISESELREVEREAEKRLRPFACGVGDCQRRYKNMNGLRYHYQHSGEHGAIGLALLASGQHECLSGSRRHDHHGHSVDGEKRGNLSGQGEREGRRRVVGVRGGGSASVPVSRAGSTSRTGTPVPAMPLTYFGQTQTTQAMPFTPPSTHILAQQLSLQSQQQLASHPASPTVPQQTMSYQQQFVTMQRQQYAQMQQQYAMYQQSQQSNQQTQGLTTGLDVNMSG